MRKLVATLALLLTASWMIGQTVSMPGPFVPRAAAGGPIVCVQGGAGCSNTTTTANGASSATSVTLTFPSNITAGHGVLVLWGTGVHAPTSITGNAGGESFTITTPTVFGGANFVGFAYVCSSVGGYTTVTLNSSAGTYFVAQALELSGVLSSSCADGSPAGATGTSTTAASGTFTPSVSGDLIATIAWSQNSGTGDTLNWTGGTVLFKLASTEQGDGAYQILANSAAQAPTWTINSGNWAAQTMGIKP